MLKWVRYVRSVNIFVFVFIVAFALIVKGCCDSCVKIIIVFNQIIVLGANCINEVTVSVYVGIEVSMHVTIIIDITPTWCLFWKLNFSLFILAFLKPLISSPDAIVEHAVLSKAVNFLKNVIVAVATSINSVVSISWLLSFCVILFDSILMAVSIELSGTFLASFWQSLEIRHSHGFISHLSLFASSSDCFLFPSLSECSLHAHWGALG